jgi:hypothetical protein
MQPNKYRNLGGLEAKVQVDIPDRVYVNLFATIVAGGLTIFAIVGGVKLLTRAKQ